MSLISKLVLAGSCVVSASIILYVHFKQQYDRDQLHIGVERDLERQRRRKLQNTYILQQQAELTKELRRNMMDKTSDEITVVEN